MNQPTLPVPAIPRLADLTPEQKRVAIAEALGIKILPNHEWQDRDDRRWFECRHCKASHGWGDFKKLGKHPDGPCPNTESDYGADLNAMHEVERTIYDQDEDSEIWKLYVKTLIHLTDLNGGSAVHCDSGTKADAFLVTVGRATL